jgi:hypothetical protein
MNSATWRFATVPRNRPTHEDEAVRLLVLAETAAKNGQPVTASLYIEMAREYRALM